MKKFLQSFHLFSDTDIDTFLSKGKLKTIAKGEYFLREGMVCKEIAFMQKGFFRSFIHNSMDEEVTYNFSFERSFLTDYASFNKQIPAKENIQAMTHSELLCFSQSDIEILQNENKNWLRFSKMIADETFFELEERLFSQLKETAEYRYKQLVDRYPEYLKVIPLNYLASYLGITQRHLTRIRKGML